ncbi:lantibiotic dehydratase [Actinomadura fulvescens]|uniref:Lantibiotic dehydratase n=1 Tax=Actinomadura fulvescens TaxID=46160 RepID=A0ABP6CW36_9ACTN
MGSRSLYRPADVVLARVTTDPGDLKLPDDLSFRDATIGLDGRGWLARTWERLDVRAAVRLASPALAEQIDHALAEAGPDREGQDRKTRRLVLALVSYLMRWQQRPTPFALFAGVTTAETARTASARFGTVHRPLARTDGTWLFAIINHLERQPDLLPRLHVVASNEGVVRGDRFVVPGRGPVHSEGPGPWVEVSVRNTRPVRAALASAQTPVPLGELADQLVAAFPAAGTQAVHALLTDLVEQGLLLTSLRPPATVVDGLGHLRTQLLAAGADRLPDLKALLADLAEISKGLARHNLHHCPVDAEAARTKTSSAMKDLSPGTGQVLAVDTAVDGQITIPSAVLHEAAAAASALMRLTAQPFGTDAWRDFHVRFRDRYGPGALVPVRELVGDSGLGFPAGFLGAARQRAARAMTDRDAVLLSLIQEAAIDGRTEIRLTEQTLTALAVGGPDEPVPPDRVELAFEVHAASTTELDRGRFQLWVTGVPRPASSLAGRFTCLLPDQARRSLADSYATGTHSASGGAAVAAQLSFPPRRLHNDNVTRTPRLLPEVISLGEHPDPTAAVISLNDLAVTADATQMYLVQASTGRRIVPRVLHALEASVQTPPLARFLAEVVAARHAVYGPFDFGAARTLPHLPRIRYGRTVLSPARWILSAAALAPTGESMQTWEKDLHAWQERWNVPTNVTLVQGELRLPLDLEHQAHRTLLRNRLDRAGRLEIREAGDPAARGWIGRACELLVPLTAVAAPPTGTPQHRPAAGTRPAARSFPGAGEVIHAQLLGHPARYDQLLTGHLPGLLERLGPNLLERWWFRRHQDTTRPDTDQHLWLHLRLASREAYPAAAAQLADFAADLLGQGLLADLTLGSYQPQTGRYGPHIPSTEQVCAADSAAALAQITMATRTGLPVQALTAASMTDLATALAPDPVTGYTWLIEQLPRHGGKIDLALRDAALHLADPNLDAVRRHPGGPAVAFAWEARRTALADYRNHFTASQTAGVFRSLLHDQHTRSMGVDPDLERTTNQLARAAALRQLARTDRPAP